MRKVKHYRVTNWYQLNGLNANKYHKRSHEANIISLLNESYRETLILNPRDTTAKQYMEFMVNHNYQRFDKYKDLSNIGIFREAPQEMDGGAVKIVYDKTVNADRIAIPIEHLNMFIYHAKYLHDYLIPMFPRNSCIPNTLALFYKKHCSLYSLTELKEKIQHIIDKEEKEKEDQCKSFITYVRNNPITPEELNKILKDYIKEN